jgi:hypothetical protein
MTNIKTKETMLISELAKLDDKVLESVVKLAKQIRGQDLHKHIPEDQIKSLRAKRDRLDAGQTISFRINPLLTFTVKVSAEYTYGDIVDFDVKVESGSVEDEKFNEVFGKMFKDYLTDTDDWWALGKLDDNVGKAMIEESGVYNSYMQDYSRIRDQFGVDPWALLE